VKKGEMNVFWVPTEEAGRFAKQHVDKERVSLLCDTIKHDGWNPAHSGDVPQLHAYCLSDALPTLEEGNHRLAAFKALKRKFFPISLHIESTACNEVEETYRRNLPIGLDEPNENMRPSQWKSKKKRVLLEICGFSTVKDTE